MYEIENIAYSRRSTAEALVARFPFAQLNVGQSFFVPDPTEPNARATPIPVNAANTLLAPATFKVREENHPVTGAAGRRVFRLEDGASEETAAE